MNRSQLLRVLEETLSIKANTLTGAEHLRDVEGWDSLATLHFIAMVDKNFGLVLPASRVAACQTVNELLGLIANRPLAA